MFSVRIANRLLCRGNSILRSQLSSLPSHQVVGMPALSPTMASGTIAKWLVKPGDSATAGDALAEVETDKATVTFESQDDFVVAKLLVEVGTEVKVGDPILVTVEDASHVSAFSNFQLAASTTPTPPAAPISAPAPAPVPAPPVAPKPVVETPKPVAETPKPIVEAPKPVATQNQSAKPTPSANSTLKKWEYGRSAENSILSKKLAALQHEYVNKYGHSGHSPLPLPAKEGK